MCIRFWLEEKIKDKQKRTWKENCYVFFDFVSFEKLALGVKKEVNARFRLNSVFMKKLQKDKKRKQKQNKRVSMPFFKCTFHEFTFHTYFLAHRKASTQKHIQCYNCKHTQKCLLNLNINKKYYKKQIFRFNFK